MCWRLLCPYVHACSRTRARTWAETWRFLSEMEEKEESLVEIPQMQYTDKVVDVPVVSPGEAGFPRSRASDTTNTAVTTIDTAVAKSAGGVGAARPPVITKLSATTAAETVDTTVLLSVGAARPAGIAEYSATEYSAEAIDTTVAMSVCEARPPGIAEFRGKQSLHQPQSLLATVKLGLQGLQSKWSQQNPNSQSLLVSFTMKLGLPGPEQIARPAPQQQQSTCLLVKIGLLRLQSAVPRQNPNLR